MHNILTYFDYHSLGKVN